MSTAKSHGIGAIATGLGALATILFSNMDTTKELLIDAQAAGGTPMMLSDLILNPAFQVILVLVAIGLGARAVLVKSESSPSPANEPRLFVFVPRAPSIVSGGTDSNSLVAIFHVLVGNIGDADTGVAHWKVELVREPSRLDRQERIREGRVALGIVPSLNGPLPMAEETLDGRHVEGTITTSNLINAKTGQMKPGALREGFIVCWEDSLTKEAARGAVFILSCRDDAGQVASAQTDVWRGGATAGPIPVSDPHRPSLR